MALPLSSVSTLPHAKLHLPSYFEGVRKHLFFKEEESVFWTEQQELNGSQILR